MYISYSHFYVRVSLMRVCSLDTVRIDRVQHHREMAITADLADVLPSRVSPLISELLKRALHNTRIL